MGEDSFAGAETANDNRRLDENYEGDKGPQGGHRWVPDGPNLTVVSKELAAKSQNEFEAIQPKIVTLEDKAIALAAPMQTYTSAKLRHQLALSRQKLILCSGLALLILGVFVFARASKNWYEEVQRYEDAKLKEEAKSLIVGKPISLIREGFWLGIPLLFAGAVLAAMIACGW